MHLVSKAWILFFSQQAGSLFHSHRGGLRWQENWRAWPCLKNWWCCTTRSCFFWPLLPLLRQSWYGLLLSRCHLCAEPFPGTWNRSPPVTLGCSSKYLYWSCLSCWSWSCSFLCWLQSHMPLLCLRVCWCGLEFATVATHRLQMDPQPMEMDVWWSWSVSCMIFETKCLRKLLHISYSKHKIYHWVQSKVNFLVVPQKPLLATAKKWKLAWFKHATCHNNLSKTILWDTLEGGRCCGQQRKCWMDNIKQWTSLSTPELLAKASCRKDWKSISAESSAMYPPMTKSLKVLNWAAHKQLTLIFECHLFSVFLMLIIE